MKDTKEFLQTGRIGVFDIPEGETRYTTRGLTYEEAIENFQREMPDGYDARDYVRINKDGKWECKVDWGSGPEWVAGDVITQIRGQSEPLYMFTPIAAKVIESPDWAERQGGAKGEMYKPEMKDIQAVEYNGENKTEILAHFGEDHKQERAGTYVIRETKDGELLVCSLEKGGGEHDMTPVGTVVEGRDESELVLVERQPLQVGQVLREGGQWHELYTNREKDFIKTKAVLNEEKTEELANVIEKEVKEFEERELNDEFRKTEAYSELPEDCKKTLDDIDGVLQQKDENRWGAERIEKDEREFNLKDETPLEVPTEKLKEAVSDAYDVLHGVTASEYIWRHIPVGAEPYHYEGLSWALVRTGNEKYPIGVVVYEGYPKVFGKDVIIDFKAFGTSKEEIFKGIPEFVRETLPKIDKLAPKYMFGLVPEKQYFNHESERNIVDNVGMKDLPKEWEPTEQNENKADKPVEDSGGDDVE